MWVTLSILQRKRDYHQRMIKRVQFYGDKRAEKFHRAKMVETVRRIHARRYH